MPARKSLPCAPAVGRSSSSAATAPRRSLPWRIASAFPAKTVSANFRPTPRPRAVRQLDARDTLYLGDGANDSLAFDAAWISGTPAIDRGLLEQKAGFYFLGRGLIGVRALLDTAALRRRTARAVVTFAIAYNAVAVALCVAGRMSPLLAAILMPASSLVSLGIVLTGFRRRRTC